MRGRDGSEQMCILETPNSGVAILTNWKGKDIRIQHHTKNTVHSSTRLSQKQKVYGEKTLTISTHIRGKALINTSQNRNCTVNTAKVGKMYIFY